jgi:protein-disulfide isomerase/uncharacterized membrane protein
MKAPAAAPEGPPRGLLWASLLLIGVGLGSSLYLGNLYLSVHRPGAGPVDSFCALSESINCVTVATSEYSSFLGLPIALYGIEFFLVLVLVVLLSELRLWALRSWDSLVFVASLLGLPVCGVLAWISATRIHSFCLMCCSIYAAVLLLFLATAVFSGRRLPALLLDGPRELLRLLPTPFGGLLATLALGLVISQFFWVPGLLRAQSMPLGSYRGQVTSGLTMGPADAPITVEEFTDFQCPYCSRAHMVMMEVMKRHKGKIHLVHRDYPLDNTCNPKITRPFHPQACRAAVFARCAAAQNKYWPFEEMLFSNSAFLSDNDLKRFAEKARIDLKRLEACVDSPTATELVQKDIAEGMRRGLRGTPTFFVNGKRFEGLRPLSFWEQKIAELTEGSR